MENPKEKGRRGVLDPATGEEEGAFDIALRPQTLEEFVGQERHKSNLRIFIEAARRRGEPLDHVLLYGPPGLGKTTLATILAREMGVGFTATSGPAIEHKGMLAGVLTKLARGDIFFIDEIHRLGTVIEENLYPAIEDFRMDIVTGEGPHASSVRLKLNPFTLVGATTRTGLLTSPLRSRFGLELRLDFYLPEEMARIVRRSAGILGLRIEEDAALEIARRSRATPRIANRLLRRVRDFAQVLGDGTVDRAITADALGRLQVDGEGLDEMDRRYLMVIIDKFEGGPVGIETISAALGEARDTIEEVYEPFLLQGGWIRKTPRGREAASRAYEHLRIPQRRGGQGTIF